MHRVRTEDRFLRITANPARDMVYVTENAPLVHAIDAGDGSHPLDR